MGRSSGYLNPTINSVTFTSTILVKTQQARTFYGDYVFNLYETARLLCDLFIYMYMCLRIFTGALIMRVHDISVEFYRNVAKCVIVDGRRAIIVAHRANTEELAEIRDEIN
jgi:hypothetical protein